MTVIHPDTYAAIAAKLRSDDPEQFAEGTRELGEAVETVLGVARAHTAVLEEARDRALADWTPETFH